MHHGDLKALRLGKKTDAAVTEAEQLHRQLDRYAYGPPTIRFTEADVDQARAAGVLIEIERGTPIITDRDAVPRAVQAGDQPHAEDLKARVAEKAQRQARRRGASASARRAKSSTPSTARTCARSPARRTARTSTSGRRC